MCSATSSFAALLAALVVMTSLATAAEPTPAQALIAQDRVLIVAHRGNSSIRPENTIPAFEAALEAKADLVELDYHHASDGVPVVIHDEHLDRTTNAREVLGGTEIKVSQTSSSDLAKLDAGSWFADKFAGTKLPTLADSLAAIQAGSTTLIERKAGDAATLIKLLEEKKLTDRVVVQAFDWQYVKDCRQLSPGLALCSLSGKAATNEQIDAAAATGADVIVWNHEKLRQEQIERIHKIGKKAWVYTIDDPQRAAQFIDWGIDGIITNKPGTMVRLRDSRPRPAR